MLSKRLPQPVIRFERLPRRFYPGQLPWLILVIFLALHLGLHLFARPVAGFCLFRTLTGINCPTCGSSRAFLTLLQGRIGQAFLYNPLILVLVSVVLAHQSLALVFKRRFTLRLAPRVRIFMTLGLLLLFFINWLYLILLLP